MSIIMFMLLFFAAVILFAIGLIMNDIRPFLIGSGFFLILSLTLFFGSVETNKVLEKVSIHEKILDHEELTTETYTYEQVNASNDDGANAFAYILMATFFVGIGMLAFTRWRLNS